MITTNHDRRQALQVFGPRLLDWANAMTRDANEAQALVQETLMIAMEPNQPELDTAAAPAWLHRLLRQRFHSVERDRSYRRSGSAAVTELGYARKRALLAQANAETSDAE